MEVIVRNGGSVGPFDHLGPAHTVAYSSEAPVDEIQDAGQMLMKAYSGAGLPNQMAMTSMIAQMQRLQEAERIGDRLFTKGLAMLYPDAAQQKARTDPWTVRVGGGGRYIQKPGIPFKVLKALRQRIEVAVAANGLRKRQLLRFAEPSTKDDAVGFKLRHMDDEHILTEQEREYLSWLTKFLLNGGREFDPMERKRKRREGLRTFFGKLTHDALDLDHVAVETIPLVSGVKGIDAFHVRDSASFYLGNFGNEIVGDEPFMFQLAYGQIEVPFTVEEVALFQRNLDSDIDSCGYGRSELESSVDTISNWVTAMAYTKGGLDDSAIPRGLLAMSGQFTRQEKEAFKAAWDAKVRGVQNAHALPVLFGGPGQQTVAQFVQTGQPFNEMAFAKWMALQASIMGAIYGFDPVELGIESFSASNKGALDGDNTEERVQLSKSQGLAPFLADLEGFISHEILARFASWPRFQFTGISDEDRKARQEDQKRMSTINEMRSALGMPAHPRGWIGDLPADPGILAAEGDRLKQTLTFNEARKVWGGLKEFPSDLVGITPINPSMGAAMQQALAAAGGGGGDEPDPDGGNPEAGGEQPENPFNDLKPKGDEEEPGAGAGEAPGGAEGAQGNDDPDNKTPKPQTPPGGELEGKVGDALSGMTPKLPGLEPEDEE